MHLLKSSTIWHALNERIKRNKILISAGKMVETNKQPFEKQNWILFIFVPFFPREKMKILSLLTSHVYMITIQRKCKENEGGKKKPLLPNDHRNKTQILHGRPFPICLFSPFSFSSPNYDTWCHKPHVWNYDDFNAFSQISGHWSYLY